jgi:prepilin-type N-terminal cleavage/methylation domain-containing protein
MTHRPHNLKAFTLLELVLVLVIITIVVGMAAPQLRFFVHGQGASDAAAQIAALARWARTQAITESTQYQLNLSSSDGTFWVTAQDATGFHPVASSLGRVFHVPPGVRLEWQPIVIPGATPTPTPANQNPNQQVATFYPDGRVDPGTIRLIDGRIVYQITCPSATEQYGVLAPNQGGA